MKLYLDTKRELGLRAGLTESQLISLLIHGLPANIRSPFFITRPKTVGEFYRLACQAEVESDNKRELGRFFRPEFKRKAEEIRTTKVKISKKASVSYPRTA